MFSVYSWLGLQSSRATASSDEERVDVDPLEITSVAGNSEIFDEEHVDVDALEITSIAGDPELLDGERADVDALEITLVAGDSELLGSSDGERVDVDAFEIASVAGDSELLGSSDGERIDALEIASVTGDPELLDVTANTDSESTPPPDPSPEVVDHAQGDASTLQSTNSEPDPLPEFWEDAREREHVLLDYVSRTLEYMSTFFSSTSFSDVRSAMSNIVQATATFRESIQGALDSQHITLDAFSNELQQTFGEIVQNLQRTASNSETPPNPDERRAMFGRMLDDIQAALLNLAGRYRIDGEAVRSFFQTLRPEVHRLLVAAANINERYPQLFGFLAFSVVIMLIPQYWFLRPFLQLFGFGVAGPIKGSIAAWSQSYFWGAAVRSGSWFAWLQAAGMGVVPSWVGLSIKIPLIGSLWGRFRNRK